MNQGMFGFSNNSYSEPITVSEFETSGSFRIPSGTKTLQFIGIGGGGGGGSGRTGAAATAAFGGGGGASGTWFIDSISTKELEMQSESELTILIGAGGAGGAAVSTTSTNGNNGSNGGATTISKSGNLSPFILMEGGSGGSGGTATNGFGGAASSKYCFFYKNRQAGQSGANSATTTAVSFSFNLGYVSNAAWCPSGAAGGGISTANVGYAGGNLSWSTGSTRMSLPLPSSGNFTFATGSAVNSALIGENGINPFLRFKGPFTGSSLGWGYGGCGGGAGTTANGGSGGDGYRGGAGGGGGAARDGFTSGAGGRGASGYCCIIAWS